LQGLASIRNQYKKLFGIRDRKQSEQSEENFERSTAWSRWGWLETIYQLTNGDKAKESEYFQMTVVEFYNRLAMIRDIQDEHKERMKQIQNANR
jgi:hypothetical protein